MKVSKSTSCNVCRKVKILHTKRTAASPQRCLRPISKTRLTASCLEIMDKLAEEYEAFKKLIENSDKVLWFETRQETWRGMISPGKASFTWLPLGVHPLSIHDHPPTPEYCIRGPCRPDALNLHL